MTNNLAYVMTTNTNYVGSKNDGSTFTFSSGTNCGNDGACIMNGNTAYDSSVRKYYYSWYAATAGQGTSSSINTDINGSICPAGWRLPATYSYDNEKSFGSIMYTYIGNPIDIYSTNTSTLESFPLNFVQDGGYRFGYRYFTTNGYYWASTAYSNANYAYYMAYGINDTRPEYGFNKSDGQYIRCVAL